MADYDALPSDVRHALAYANHNWSSAEALEVLIIGFTTTEYLIGRITLLDQGLAEQHEDILRSGRPYPTSPKQSEDTTNEEV